MNFIKLFVFSAILLYGPVHAMSQEEFCHGQVESAVKHKHYFKNHPGSLEFSLKRLEESNLDKRVKDAIRADLFFISNRKDISDETLRSMVLVRCLKQARE